MKTSHAGLGINEEEWIANLELTRHVLKGRGMATREQTEFLSLFENYKNDIVEPSKSPQISSE